MLSYKLKLLFAAVLFSVIVLIGVIIKHSEQETPRFVLNAQRVHIHMGNDRSQLKLGEAYHSGIGVEKKDDKEAIYWWRKAADQGNVDALLTLGDAYNEGWGVGEDTKEAIKWYRKAAEGQYVLWTRKKIEDAHIYGIDVERNDKISAEWWRLAVIEGKASDEKLMMRVMKGGTPNHLVPILSPEERLELLATERKSAEQGNAERQYDLGNRYHYGWSVEKNDGEAVKWWHRAADQGHDMAQNALGDAYHDGRGVKRDDKSPPKNPKKS